MENRSPARDLATRLADNAEAVCRHYLPNGRREGHYWTVGDVGNAPGRSLYVRLSGGEGGRRAGKWTDAASGDHGDLLDIIAATCAHGSLRDTLAEARRFLGTPEVRRTDRTKAARPSNSAQPGSAEAAHRLWTATRPTSGTPVLTYLCGRAIRSAWAVPSIRYHPRCYYRRAEDDVSDVRSAYPAMIAAVTDLGGALTGVHRTWLAPSGRDKAEVACPRRAMGHLLGHGVRFGPAAEVMAFGEGVETMLSVREVAPRFSMIAGLSSAHLSALQFPAPLRRVYVARDRDAAGEAALSALTERAAPLGIVVRQLEPKLDDFNSDLRRFGPERLASHLRSQLAAGDEALLIG